MVLVQYYLILIFILVYKVYGLDPERKRDGTSHVAHADHHTKVKSCLTFRAVITYGVSPEPCTLLFQNQILKYSVHTLLYATL